MTLMSSEKYRRRVSAGSDTMALSINYMFVLSLILRGTNVFRGNEI